MKKNQLAVFVFLGLLVIAGLVFVNLIQASKALSYFSSDPKACINCHVMNTQYASWQHSAHASVATCVDCHLPAGQGLAKYMAKARDGWNHSYALTAGTYKSAIQNSKDGGERVQKNCIRCHSTLVTTLKNNSELNHGIQGNEIEADQNCWHCHRDVPHGKARGITSVPYNLGVKDVN